VVYWELQHGVIQESCRRSFSLVESITGRKVPMPCCKMLGYGMNKRYSQLLGSCTKLAKMAVGKIIDYVKLMLKSRPLFNKSADTVRAMNNVLSTLN